MRRCEAVTKIERRGFAQPRNVSTSQLQSVSPLRRFTASPLRYSSASGFTLIELLIVITIIGMMFSVSLPVTYSMYQRYQASLKAERVLTLVSSMRMDAFLYGRERLIESRDGSLLIDGNDSGGFKDVFIQVDSPIKFYSTGLTSGGEIKIYAGNSIFLIRINAPLGALVMKTG